MWQILMFSKSRVFLEHCYKFDNNNKQRKNNSWINSQAQFHVDYKN